MAQSPVQATSTGNVGGSGLVVGIGFGHTLAATCDLRMHGASSPVALTINVPADGFEFIPMLVKATQPHVTISPGGKATVFQVLYT